MGYWSLPDAAVDDPEAACAWARQALAATQATAPTRCLIARPSARQRPPDTVGERDAAVLDMVRSHNFAPGNAGVIFWTDILLPVFGLALLAATRR